MIGCREGTAPLVTEGRWRASRGFDGTGSPGRSPFEPGLAPLAQFLRCDPALFVVCHPCVAVIGKRMSKIRRTRPVGGGARDRDGADRRIITQRTDGLGQYINACRGARPVRLHDRHLSHGWLIANVRERTRHRQSANQSKLHVLASTGPLSQGKDFVGRPRSIRNIPTSGTLRRRKNPKGN